MRKLVLAALLISFAAYAQFERLELQPKQPKQGEKIKITYNPSNGKLQKAQKIFITAYLLIPDQEAVLKSLKTQSNGQTWEATLTIDSPAVGVFFHIHNDKETDTNQGIGYYVLLTDRKGNFLPHANGQLGIFYETTAVRLLGERKEGFAAQLYRQELNCFPSNQRPYLFYLIATLLNTKSQVNDLLPQFDKIIEQDMNFLTERELGIAAYICRELNRNSQAEMLTAEELRRFPTGITARMQLYERFQQAQAIDHKLAIFAEFKEKIGIDERYFLSMVNSIIHEYIKQQQYDEIINFVQTFPLEAQTAQIYAVAASELMKTGNGQLSQRALQMAHSLIAFAEEEIQNMMITQNLANLSHLALALAQAQSVAGQILLKEGKAPQALILLEKAKEFEWLLGESYRESYVLALAKAGEPAKALEVLSAMVRENKTSNVVIQALQQCYIRAKGNEEGWQEYLSNLQAEALKKLTEEITAQLIDLPAPLFSLPSLTGDTVSLAALRGKVVVIDFWATWCTPCIASFPAMQQVQNAYHNRSDVQFFFINSWERSQEKRQHVADFIAKKGYHFNVLMDEDNRVISAYQVSSIPTKFIIDKQGRIRFKSIGHENSPALTIRQMQIIIDMLTSM